MRPLLCVTVTAPTTAELRLRRDAVCAGDLVELRLDSVSDPDVAGALADRRRPVIVTCRPAWEGGWFDGSEEERRRLLSEALALGAEYVDVEWRARFDGLIAGAGGRRIVLSMHDFDGVPADLEAQAAAMCGTGAEVVKLAVLTRKLSDCVPLLEIGSRNGGAPGAESGGRRGLVLIGMGEPGIATRVLASRFGSMWTYAGAQGDLGQLTADQMIEGYRFRSLSKATHVYGVVGRPVSHTLSPAMHNAAFQASGIDGVYLPFPADDVEDFVTFARALNIKGASVTTPYKVALFGRADEASDVACRTGALNTLRMDRGRWEGHNTDVSGFLEPLQDRLALPGTRAAVIGAGGAARAVAVALRSRGAAVRVHARNVNLARDVAALAAGEVGPWPPDPGSWDLLINCTSIGMYPQIDQTPLRSEQLTGHSVYDLVYNPPVTRLLREAAIAGCETIGGLEMLVAQAH